MDIERRLTRITSLTSFVIALTIVIFVPLGFFLTAYSYESIMLQEQADNTAEALSKHIYAFPDSWQFQDHRLEDIILQASWHDNNIHYHVTDNSGTQLIDVGTEPPLPVHSAKASLTNGEEIVGWVNTYAGLRPLLLRTTASAFVAILIALSVHYTLRVLPFAALSRVLRTLENSQQKLAQEIEAKEQALAEHRNMTDAIRHQAMHDTLTGLPNRAQFDQQLKKRLQEHPTLAVMIIDLNRFKEINDTLGHQTGDATLIEASKRIRRVLPDRTFLARLGGDEFALLAPGATKSDAHLQAQGITQALQSHIVVDEYHLAISASIGIALFPDHGENSQQVMRHADVAMYQAKKSGQPFCFYNNSYDENNPSRLTLTADFRHALDTNGLSLHFQPKIDLTSGEIVGVEALTRWSHPEHGYISPEVFITIAEQAGMINPLTDWVLDAALWQLSAWHRTGLPMHVAVNISARNLQNEKLVLVIRQLLRKHHLQPQFLTLEITESSIMIDPVQSLEIIQQLSDRGVNIAVDDFGTGYSSLAYLKKLPVDELKIDRSFVQNMLNDNDDQVIVRSTIDLAHNLKLKVVAEGIENQESYHLLREFGCDTAQGFYLCKPVSPEIFEQWARKNIPIFRTARQ